MTDSLNTRAEILLKTLIEQYIEGGHPVGSKQLLKRSGLSVSAATIRNVMADLETKNAILIVTNSEVGHIHPNSQIIKMHKIIKKHYSDRFELPFFY